jgi:hypothetical protein
MLAHQEEEKLQMDPTDGMTRAVGKACAICAIHEYLYRILAPQACRCGATA